jgi:2-epi-5-epi-valiolone 7-kinase
VQTEVIAFDIGGTWFRSGLAIAKNELVSVTRRPAINYTNTAYREISDLQTALVDYLVVEANRLRSEHASQGTRLVGISMGACINAHSGRVLNSGPLWGVDCVPFDLLAALRTRAPHFDWVIINDITAALLRHKDEPTYADAPRMTLITVSTGIGCRTYDARLHTVPVDPVHGVQGEIGHIPISFSYREQPIILTCDCGALNHVNAFCSGRGIASLIPLLSAKYTDDFHNSLLSELSQGLPGRVSVEDLVIAVHNLDSFALSILDAVTFPLAHIIVNLLTIDPEVEYVLFVGGVVNSFGSQYLESLLHRLDSIGLYQVTLYDPEFFKRRIRFGFLDDSSGLIGAALAARAYGAEGGNV